MATTIISTIGTSGRDYSTFSAWEAATGGNLISADEERVGEAYSDSNFTAGFRVAGGVVDATRRRRVYAASGHEYDPSDDTGVKFANVTGAIVRIGDEYTEVKGIGVVTPSTSSTTLAFQIDSGSGGSVVERCYAHVDQSNSSNKSYCVFHQDLLTAGGPQNTIRNCIFVVDAAGSCVAYGIWCNRTSDTPVKVDVYNCSVYSIATDGTALDVGVYQNTAGVQAFENLRNVVVAGFTSADFGTLTFSSGTQSHNTSSDSTAPGTDAQTSKSAANNWVDPDNGDFTPQNDILDAGVDLSGTFTDDFYGNTRS